MNHYSSDYKRGKNNAEVWADRTKRFIERSSRSSNPLAKLIEYKTSVVMQAFTAPIPQGIEFTDPVIRQTGHIILCVIPIWQREELIDYLFSEDKKRETSDIRAIYERIGRELRGSE